MYSYYLAILAERSKCPTWDGEVLDCNGRSMEVVYDFMKKEVRFESKEADFENGYKCDEETKDIIRSGGWKEENEYDPQCSKCHGTGKGDQVSDDSWLACICRYRHYDGFEGHMPERVHVGIIAQDFPPEYIHIKGKLKIGDV